MAELPDYIGFDRENEDTWYDYGEAWRPWLSAVTGHHGVLPEEADSPNVADMPKEIRALDHAARKEWVKSLEAWLLHPVGLSLQDRPPLLFPLLAGFCAVCDWLGSNSDPRYFPYQNCREEGLAYSPCWQGFVRFAIGSVPTAILAIFPTKIVGRRA